MYRKIFFFIVTLSNCIVCLDIKYHNFVVIIPSYNNNRLYRGKLLFKQNLDSVFFQTYPHYRIIYIDDNSSDGTAQEVFSYVKELNQEKRIKLLKNKIRLGQLPNRYKAAHMCRDDEIIVMLDGDDFLAHENVLKYLNEIYQDSNVWMTYGQFKQLCQDCIWLGPPLYAQSSEQCMHKQLYCDPLPPKYIIKDNLWRQYIVQYQPSGTGWIFSHLRTFYAKLYKKINVRDLTVNGTFYTRGTDIAETLPIVEMCGRHIKFIPNILYIWTFDNFWQNNLQQDGPTFWYAQMLKKKCYEPLAILFE